MISYETRASGGRAAAKIVKEKYIKKYEENPNHCLWCGKVIEVKEGQTAREARAKKYCDQSCAAKYNNKARGFILKNERIPKVPIFRVDETVSIGSLFGKGASKYAQVRGKARAKMNFYKIEKKCSVCGYDKHVEIHHKKLLSTYSPNTPLSVVNDMENLMYLCPNHHWEFDNRLISL